MLDGRGRFRALQEIVMKDDMWAVLDRATWNLHAIAKAITPLDAMPMQTPDGGYVGSLTEAVCYTAASLSKIADAIGDLAEAVRERG